MVLFCLKFSSIAINDSFSIFFQGTCNWKCSQLLFTNSVCIYVMCNWAELRHGVHQFSISHPVKCIYILVMHDFCVHSTLYIGTSVTNSVWRWCTLYWTHLPNKGESQFQKIERNGCSRMYQVFTTLLHLKAFGELTVWFCSIMFKLKTLSNNIPVNFFHKVTYAMI